MKKILIFWLLLFSTLSIAADPAIDISVNLTPAGSFQITTPKIKGKVKKSKKGTFTAKKLTVKVKDLKTGIELRDDHMQKRIN